MSVCRGPFALGIYNCLNAVSVAVFIVFNNTQNHLQYNGQAGQDSYVIPTGWGTTVSMSNSSTSTHADNHM